MWSHTVCAYAPVYIQVKKSSRKRQGAVYFRICRAITTRWIWLVPSQLWVVVDQRAVRTGRWHTGWGWVSTDSARFCTRGPHPL